MKPYGIYSQHTPSQVNTPEGLRLFTGRGIFHHNMLCEPDLYIWENHRQ